MEYSQAPQCYLNDLCRGCLLRSDNMLHFSPQNPETAQFVAMLAAVGSFEIEINDALPSFLCNICEQKLRASYDFQMLLQHSNEVLRQCLNGDITIHDETDVVATNTTVVKNESECENDSGDSSHKSKLILVPTEEIEIEIGKFKTQYETEMVCIECNYTTRNKRSLTNHMSQLHKDLKSKWCSKCNNLTDNLEEHIMNHTVIEQTCRFCQKVITGRTHFIEHLLAHARNRPFQCNFCTRSFTLQRHLDQHLTQHNENDEECVTDDDDMNCDSSEETSNCQNFCTVCQRRVRSLKNHYEAYHEDQQKPPQKELLCTVCGKMFKSYSKLSVHMRIHTGETPYECSYCQKRMPCRSQLVVHLRIHTGEKPHSCKICGKTFAQSSSLNTHMKLHTGRSDKCDICGKMFCRPSLLKNHMRKHTGEKPYVCQECGQAFIQRSHLVGHMKTHSDERPFQCCYCPKSFKDNSTLKSHTNIHLGEKPYKCTQCPYACRQSHSLTQHMKQHNFDTDGLEDIR